MKIAFFTPVSPIQSALADFGEGLALALAQQPNVSVDLYLDGTYTPNNPQIKQLNCYSHHDFVKQKHKYDTILYSMGDSGTYHGYMIDYIYSYPGVVIMNDITIHRAIISETVGKGNPQGYLEELQHAYGSHAFKIVSQLESGLGNELLLKYPLFERTVDHSTAIIVQNNYARDRILEKRPLTKIQTIPYPFFMPPGIETNPLTEGANQRKQLGLESEQIVLGSFGIFVPNKHLEACLSAFKQLVDNHKSAHYILGGSPANGYDLQSEIRRMGLDNHVTITGWLPPPEFARQMYALDIGIHLRHPHIGGTPYTPIRLMGLGVATIVSDIEPLAELPLGSCAKIHPDDYAEKSLQALLSHLAEDKILLNQLKETGRQFIQKHHLLQSVAHAYVAFLTAV